MTTRAFWLGIIVGFWIGVVLGTLTMAARAESNTICIPEHNCGQTPLVFADDPTLTVYDKYGHDVKLCLAQMEAAMRAMEPYLVGPITRAVRADWERVTTQWFQVTHECWRRP